MNSSYDSSFASKKVLFEKIEILDESTGQIILKERVVYGKSPGDSSEHCAEIDLDSAGHHEQLILLDDGAHEKKAKCLSDDQAKHGGPGGCSSDEFECHIAFPHPSIVSKTDIANLQPIQVNSSIDKNGHSTTFYRCPLCPIKTAYYNLLASKCIDHLNSNKHLGMAVKHHQWYICKCEETLCLSGAESSCSPSTSSQEGHGSASTSGGKNVHYHCPHCSSIFTKRNDLKNHLDGCCTISSGGSRHIPSHSSGSIRTSPVHVFSAAAATPADSVQISSHDKSTSNRQPQYNVLYLVNQPAPTVSATAAASTNAKPILRCINTTTGSLVSSAPTVPSINPSKRILTIENPHRASSPLVPATKIIKLINTSDAMTTRSTTSTSDSVSSDGNLSLVDFQQLQQSLGIDSSASTVPSASVSTDDDQNQMISSSAGTHQIVNLASSNHANKSHALELDSDASSSVVDSVGTRNAPLPFRSSHQKMHSMSQHNYNQTSNHADYSYHKSSSSSLYNSGLPAHIVQNYSILANEIIAPLDSPAGNHYGNKYADSTTPTAIYDDIDYSSVLKQWTNAANQAVEAAAASKKTSSKHPLSKRTSALPMASNSSASIALTTASMSSSASSQSAQFKSQKDTATCQFCGRFMLKKNIPTHIRRAHTPKEELVCLNEEQCIFTLQHLKPGQRRKRSARAYDYSLMTAKVSIDDDPCDSIENKFIMFGEEILNTDLVQLSDRIKYGISQIPVSTLTALVEILTKIQNSNNQEEICEKAKELKNKICYFLASGEEFKYKLRQVGDEILTKKTQVNALRTELKDIMSKKAQLERRIQPLVCDLQRLEDHHGSLVETIYRCSSTTNTTADMSSMFDYSLNNSNNASSNKYDGDEEDQQENSNTEDAEEEEEEES